MKKIHNFTYLSFILSSMMIFIFIIIKLLAAIFFYVTKGIFYFGYESLIEYAAIAICSGCFLSTASCLIQYFQHKKNR